MYNEEFGKSNQDSCKHLRTKNFLVTCSIAFFNICARDGTI